MSTRFRYYWIAGILLFIFTTASAFGIWRVSAAGEQPPGPDRFDVVLEEYTSYEWWLTSWGDNQVACSITIDHEGLPTGNEILNICGISLYEKWLATNPCDTSEGESTACKGYYLSFHKSETAKRNIGVSIPAPQVWVTLDGCLPYNSTFRCDNLPTLILTAEEPLKSEHITDLVVRLNGEVFSCDPICQVDLAPTGEDGLYLEFWANSSYGDSSALFTARVRVAAAEDPLDTSLFVDVLSDQWRGTPLAACSQTWNIFPVVGGVPIWLSTPSSGEELASDITYEFLAANLIKQGVADISACEDGGLLENGNVSPCGLDAARSAVIDWQNRFDSLIYKAAQEINIPARLLKNIFSRESQFWPTVTEGHDEAGLGQLTKDGADATLLWNRLFFERFCPSELDEATCNKGYAHLGAGQQDQLRDALVMSVNAICPECTFGIDLERIETSIDTFAETLLANCAQTGMVVELNDRKESGTTVSYDDFWRFSLVNYNAGPGCLGLAVDQTSRKGEPMDWEHVSSHLTPACQGASDYVIDITSGIP